MTISNRILLLFFWPNVSEHILSILYVFLSFLHTHTSCMELMEKVAGKSSVSFSSLKRLVNPSPVWILCGAEK